MGTVIWLVLLIGALLTLAYRRTDLKTSTAVLGALLVVYWLFGDGGGLWNLLLLVAFLAIRAAQHRIDPPRQRHAPPVRHLPQHAAEHVEDRAGSARSRQRLVGRRAVHGHAGLAALEKLAAAEADARGASVPRRADRGALPSTRRLADYARARRHAAERVAVHQGPTLLRDDHPEGVRRPRLLAARELDGARENRVAERHGIVDDRRAELARPGRAPAALRHRGAEATLAARASRAAKKCRASRSRRHASAPTQPHSSTTASSAKARGRARRSSAFA